MQIDILSANINKSSAFFIKIDDFDNQTRLQQGCRVVQNAEKLFLSLADHDPIYDFLYVKNLILKNNIQIIKSLKFCEIMSLTPENYFSKLCSARNFKPLDY